MDTVQDVFEMRRRGQTEAAFESAQKLYKNHHGKYMSLCMFYTAMDMCYLKFDRDEAAYAGRIFASLVNLYPNLSDEDNAHKDKLDKLAAYIGMPVDRYGFYDIEKYIDGAVCAESGVYFDEDNGEVYGEDDYYLIVARKPNGAKDTQYIYGEDLCHATRMINEEMAKYDELGYSDVRVFFNGRDIKDEDEMEPDPEIINEPVYTPAADDQAMRRYREHDGQLLLFQDDQLLTDWI